MIDKYLSCGNIIAALKYAVGVKEKKQIDTKLITKILFSFLETPVAIELGNMDAYYLELAFKKIWADPNIERDDVLKLEWAFLNLWHRHDEKVPIFINKTIASEPGFFAELISYAFKPRNSEQNNVAVSPQHAEKAYYALELWNLLPGQSENNKIDFDVLKTWVVDARKICGEIDRLEIGDQYIGHIFAKHPSVRENAIPDRAILQILDENISDNISGGFQIQVTNNRGVRWLDVNNPGKDDRELANLYKSTAHELMIDYPNVSKIYHSIALSFEHDATWQEENSDLDGF